MKFLFPRLMGFKVDIFRISPIDWGLPISSLGVHDSKPSSGDEKPRSGVCTSLSCKSVRGQFL